MIPMLRTFATCAAIALPAAAQATVDIQVVTSPGGIEAWLVEEPSIPFVAMEIRFEGGASLDLPGKRGATNLMAGLLEEGAGERDAQAFAEAREEIAASFSFDAGHDAVSVSAQFLTETTDEALALLRDAFTLPRFDEEAVERVRDQVIAVIAQDENDPQEIASATLANLFFPDHPYGTPIDGTSETVSALTVEDLRTAHSNALTRDRVQVGVTGDISPEELGPLLDKLFADLPESGGPEVGRAEIALDGGVTVVEFPGPQSAVSFGQAGVGFEDPDYFPAFVLNHVLGGGGFGSRLTQEVRVARGLTYGIGTGLAARDHAEQILGGFSTANATTAEAIEIVRAEWARMAEGGITDEELEAAKTYLTGAYPLRFDGNARIAGILVGMQSLGLTPDYIEGRNDRVRAVTSEDVARVARRLLDADDVHFVVVGRPEGLQTGAFSEG